MQAEWRSTRQEGSCPQKPARQPASPPASSTSGSRCPRSKPTTCGLCYAALAAWHTLAVSRGSGDVPTDSPGHQAKFLVPTAAANVSRRTSVPKGPGGRQAQTHCSVA